MRCCAWLLPPLIPHCFRRLDVATFLDVGKNLGYALQADAGPAEAAEHGQGEVRKGGFRRRAYPRLESLEVPD
jgi:hypothetical protein